MVALLLKIEKVDVVGDGNYHSWKKNVEAKPATRLCRDVRDYSKLINNEEEIFTYKYIYFYSYLFLFN